MSMKLFRIYYQYRSQKDLNRLVEATSAAEAVNKFLNIFRAQKTINDVTIDHVRRTYNASNLQVQH